MTVNFFTVAVMWNLNVTLMSSGGIASPAISWVYIVPILLLVMIGVRSGIVWIGILTVNIIALYFYSSEIEVKPVFFEEHLFNTLSLFFFLCIIMFLFWKFQNNLMRQLELQQVNLEEAREELASTNETLELQNKRLNETQNALIASNQTLEKYAHTLKLQVLQSQMNPHFIFNALEAIQDFVAGKDERAANKYLSNFSKLMRLFLESSKEKYISLEEELKLLELYMELEQLRFKPPFDFEIDCPDSIDWGAVEIPSMLLQPFVENAINHGLKYKKGKGFIKIHIRENGDQLNVKIIDNGVGVKKAKEIKQKATKSYKSRSTEITEERLKTIESMDNIKVSIDIEDRFVEGEIKGTIVNIICPFFETF